VYLKVKVTPAGKRDELKEISPDTFAATVRAPAKHHLANRAVAGLLASHFGLPVSRVKLISGHHSPGKIFDIQTSVL